MDKEINGMLDAFYVVDKPELEFVEDERQLLQEIGKEQLDGNSNLRKSRLSL